MKKIKKKKIILGIIILMVIATILILITFGLPQNISSGVSSISDGGILG